MKEFRLNGAGFTARFLRPKSAWVPVKEKGVVLSIDLNDDGGNPERARITLYLLRKWMVGNHVSKLEEVL